MAQKGSNFRSNRTNTTSKQARNRVAVLVRNFGKKMGVSSSRLHSKSAVGDITRVWFLVYDDQKGDVRVAECDCTLAEREQGFLYGEMYLPPYFLCDSELEAYKTLRITRHDLDLNEAKHQA